MILVENITRLVCCQNTCKRGLTFQAKAFSKSSRFSLTKGLCKVFSVKYFRSTPTCCTLFNIFHSYFYTAYAEHYVFIIPYIFIEDNCYGPLLAPRQRNYSFNSHPLPPPLRRNGYVVNTSNLYLVGKTSSKSSRQRQVAIF